VSDYTPAKAFTSKIKKRNGHGLVLDLRHTPDILAEISLSDDRPNFVVGFAAETDNIEAYARDKLQRKQLDMIAANLVGEDLAMGTDDNALMLFWSDGQVELPLSAKAQLARDLMNLIIERYDAKNSA
jgi:phosphopantothenoylcysteine decarboxylase/phosphopantothenate--cysteine ligase